MTPGAVSSTLLLAVTPAVPATVPTTEELPSATCTVAVLAASVPMLLDALESLKLPPAPVSSRLGVVIMPEAVTFWRWRCEECRRRQGSRRCR